MILRLVLETPQAKALGQYMLTLTAVVDSMFLTPLHGWLLFIPSFILLTGYSLTVLDRLRVPDVSSIPVTTQVAPSAKQRLAFLRVL